MKSNGIGVASDAALRLRGRTLAARIRGLFGLLGLGTLLTVASLAYRADLTAASPPTQGEIVKLTAQILGHSQLAHHPLDEELAGKFLDRYLDALDANHTLFLQSDLAEFAPYRSRLADLTRQGETRPAYVIFHRYLERLGQEAGYMTNWLHTGTFDFSGHDAFDADHGLAPRPRDLPAAQALWRERVRYEYLQEKLNGKSPAEIVKTLTRRYTRLRQTMQNLSNEEVLGMYLDALAHVYDPHSDYLDREELDNFSIAMNLSLSGIGATLQPDDGYCRIHDLVPGGPAAKSHQLQVGDRIVAVAQKGQPPLDIIDLPLPQAVELIRGPNGSEVTLTIIPADAPEDAVRKTVTLVREEVRLEDQRAQARVIDLPRAGHQTVRLGVIDLPSFYGSLSGKGRGASATKDVALLLRKLNRLGVQGVVLDLRQNGGGSLNEAIGLTGLFLRKGPIVQTRDADGRIQVDDNPDASAVYDGPLFVLTSRFTASASEILAGALQDYGRAVIVGDSSTFGKGTVQSLIPLQPLMERKGLTHGDNPGALKITVSKFYRPDGASTQLRGVKADVVLPSLTDNPKFGEAALLDPLPWDQVPPARYAHWDRVQPYLNLLRAMSAARVASDADYGYLKREISEVKSHQATEVSLNEARLRAEKQKAAADQKAWETKLAALPKPSLKEYDITVKTALRPGLPPPVRPSEGQGPPAAGVGLEPGLNPKAAALLGDPILREAEHILADYVELTRRGATVTQADTRASAGRQPRSIPSGASVN